MSIYDFEVPPSMGLKAPVQNVPMASMPGTLSPEDERKKQEQMAMVSALRQPQLDTIQPVPAASGKVTSSGCLGQGMNTSAVGNALGQMFK